MKRSLEIERAEETHQAKRRRIEDLQQQLADMEHQYQALNNQDASPQQYVELIAHQQQCMAEIELQLAQTDASTDTSTDDTDVSSDSSYIDSDTDISWDDSVQTDADTDDTEPESNECHDGPIENLVEPIEQMDQQEADDIDWDDDIDDSDYDSDWDPDLLPDEAIHQLVDAIHGNCDEGYESDTDDDPSDQEDDIIEQNFQDAIDLAHMNVVGEIWNQLNGDEGYSSDYENEEDDDAINDLLDEHEQLLQQLQALDQEEIINEQHHQEVMAQHQQEIEELDHQLAHLNQLLAQQNVVENNDS